MGRMVEAVAVVGATRNQKGGRRVDREPVFQAYAVAFRFTRWGFLLILYLREKKTSKGPTEQICPCGPRFPLMRKQEAVREGRGGGGAAPPTEAPLTDM